jgi:adenylosuccinate synthase
MPAHAVVGANWGDEGKGKLADVFASRADLVVRDQGGRNAGHTVIHERGRFVLHQLPAGVFHAGVVNVLGPGVALDVPALLSELDELRARGFDPIVRVSDRAQVVMPQHALLDRLEEDRLGPRGFGSTRVGIAPFYGDKLLKRGVQVAELLDRTRLAARVSELLPPLNAVLCGLYGHAPLALDDVLGPLAASIETLRPFVADTRTILVDALRRDRNVLLEGQLGALRDPDHGIYPWTTSSSTLAGHAAVGAGLPPRALERITAVTKAYSSCVGAGPFVTELEDEDGERLRARGGDRGEYGATTGRPRRVGWFDAVATAYGAQVQGATELALTGLDALSGMQRIPVCTAYEIDGERRTVFPSTGALERARPVYAQLEGWSEDVRDVRCFEYLPAAARAYVRYVERATEVPLRWVSVGPERSATFELPGATPKSES